MKSPENLFDVFLPFQTSLETTERASLKRVVKSVCFLTKEGPSACPSSNVCSSSTSPSPLQVVKSVFFLTEEGPSACPSSNVCSASTSPSPLQVVKRADHIVLELRVLGFRV